MWNNLGLGEDVMSQHHSTRQSNFKYFIISVAQLCTGSLTWKNHIATDESVDALFMATSEKLKIEVIADSEVSLQTVQEFFQ